MVGSLFMIVPLYERYVRHLSLRPSRQLKNGSNADQVAIRTTWGAVFKNWENSSICLNA